MKYFLTVILFLYSGMCLSQDSGYKDKGYEADAMNYVMSEVKRTSSTFDDCLNYTKPFSKWDLQSLNSPKIWLFGNLQNSGTFPNLLFGALAKRFNVSLDDVSDMPDKFLRNAVNNFGIYEKDAINNAAGYFDLIELLKKSQSKIFLNQDNLQRVDNMFYENGIYWKYIIPEDSPFPVSDSISTNITESFSQGDFFILDKMKSLGIYAAYNDKEIIYLLKDGMLDNSFGYYFKDNDIDYRKKNHLFNIMSEELIMPRFYYYVTN
ncbi:MAG TPA: hypothetical protein VHP32_07375 [Ignavibacteria bacterium]|nr:hypothetical protein [Ignavibacteria bacterium]